MGKGVVTSFTNFTPGNSGETVTFNFSEITGKPFRKGNPPKKTSPSKKVTCWTDRSRIFCSWFLLYGNLYLFLTFKGGHAEYNMIWVGLISFWWGGWTWLMAFWDLFYLYRRKCYANFAITWLFATPVLPKKWNVEAGIWMLHPKNKTNFPVFQTKKTWKQSGEG